MVILQTRRASGFWLGLACACALAVPAFAERWRVEGATLYFNTETGAAAAGIERGDVEALKTLLDENPVVEILSVNSAGGGLYAALDMADIVIDFDLDTAIDALCESSCMYLFLGGSERVMARGARAGFHRMSWSAGSIERYFERHRASEEWDTPFEMASQIYEDAQREVFDILGFMVSRGVDPAFAVETLQARADDMWSPNRAVLLAAGVLTR